VSDENEHSVYHFNIKTLELRREPSKCFTFVLASMTAMQVIETNIKLLMDSRLFSKATIDEVRTATTKFLRDNPRLR